MPILAGECMLEVEQLHRLRCLYGLTVRVWWRVRGYCIYCIEEILLVLTIFSFKKCEHEV